MAVGTGGSGGGVRCPAVVMGCGRRCDVAAAAAALENNGVVARLIRGFSHVVVGIGRWVVGLVGGRGMAQ